MRDTRHIVHSSTPFVLVRSFDGEPRRIVRGRASTSKVEVSDDTGHFSIWFPKESVYRWDETLSQRLEAAYKEGERSTLDGLWRMAVTIE